MTQFLKCSIRDCNKEVTARGLCDMHYRRLLRTGDPTKVKRPGDWGKREAHPLYGAWTWLRRQPFPLCEEWKDFWQFVQDVKERPDASYTLARLDISKPASPDNTYWRKKITGVRTGETSSEFARRYQKEYCLLHPDRTRNSELKKRYGITLDWYNSQLQAQGGICAICKQAETSFNRIGNVQNLAVDHHHKSGKPRELLCSNCNRGLGCFKDDIDLMKKAILYLEKHDATQVR